VILVDANLLVYSFTIGMRQQPAARAWLDEQLSGRARIGLPWASLLAFLRLVTNPRMMPNPVPIAAAWSQVEEWLDAPPSWIPNPTERHRETLASILPRVSGPNDMPDAHLAALAIEHGLILATADRGFARFPGLRWENPLASA